MTGDEKKRIFQELKRKAESDEDIILGCGRFEEALSSSAREGMKAALEMLSVKAQYEDFLEGDRKIIVGYSKLVGTAGGIRIGRREMNYPVCLLNPYYGSAEEMYALTVLNSDGSSLPITALVTGAADFLVSLGEYSPSLRKAAYPYLNTWMKDLLEVTGENISSLMNDRNEDYDPDGPGALSLLLEALIADGHFIGVISYAFSLLGENIARAEKCDLRPSSPLNTAVRTGDMETFENFYASGIIRNIVHRKREEGLDYGSEAPGINRGKIMVYPLDSTEMLDRLFSLGLLLPGSEDGREAFDDAVSNGSPSREILTRIRHPSYFTTGFGRPLSPLVKAVRNPSFSPENYDLLVASPWDILSASGEDDALPPIGEAYSTGDVNKVDALIALGADILWPDRWGNNILHRIYGKTGDDFRLYPMQGEDALFFVSNDFEKLPCEYCAKPKRESLGDFEYRSFDDVLSLFEEHPASSFFYRESTPGDLFIGRVFERVGKRVGDTIPVRTITTYEGLLECWKESAKEKRVRLAFIPDISLVENGRDARAIIMNLYRERSVILFTAAGTFYESLLREIASSRRINIFLGRTKTDFPSDILLSRGGSSSLEEGEFIVKTRDGCFLTKPLEEENDSVVYETGTDDGKQNEGEEKDD